MTDQNGSPDEMPVNMSDPYHLDDNTLDRLLDGLLVDDAPPRYRSVALMLHDLDAPATWAEFGDERAAVATLARRLQPTAPSRAHAVSAARPRHRLRVVGAALVGSSMLFLGLGAAGALPGPAETVASDVLGTVGISTPGAQSNNSGSGDGGATNGATNSSSDPSGQGGTISSIAHDQSKSGLDKGKAVSGAASDGNSNAGNPPGATAPKGGKPDQTGKAPSNPQQQEVTTTTESQANTQSDVGAENAPDQPSNKP